MQLIQLPHYFNYLLCSSSSFMPSLSRCGDQNCTVFKKWLQPHFYIAPNYILCLLLKTWHLMVSCIMLIFTTTAHWCRDLRDLPRMTPRCFSRVLNGHSEFSITGHGSDFLLRWIALDLSTLELISHLPSQLSFATFLLSSEAPSASWQWHLTSKNGFIAPSKLEISLHTPGHWWKYLENQCWCLSLRELTEEN